MEIVIVIIVVICILQIAVFGANLSKLKIFKQIFPNTNSLSIDVIDDFVQGIDSQSNNPIFKVIVSSINKYLSSNKGQVSDYHLIKDIVDRNTDAKEDEINTLIPIPLYLGLVGTMACILIGLIELDLSTVIEGSEKAMIDGINPLLSGVAVAMITSTLGIILTTIGSYIAKNSRAKVEESKNNFLSWMQEKLLPQLSNDTASVLLKMTQDLSDFNKTFAQNNAQFTATLSKVVDTSDKQAELIKLISQLQDKRITTKNLELLNVLEKWVANLQNVKDYNDLLLNQYVEIGAYFKTEREQIEQRKTLLAETLNKVDSNSNIALSDFNENFNVLLQKVQETFESKISSIGDTLATQQEMLKDALNTQNETLLKSIEHQQKIIAEKLQDTTKFVDELNKVGDKIASISRLEKAMSEQNGKISDLTNSIKELAKKAGGNSVDFSMPRWAKISIIASVGIIVVFCLLELTMKVLSLI